MSHIDEGDIQAYLDGAYHLLTPDQRREIEERLESDPAFREEVEEAREMRAEAARILGEADIEDLEPPPFAEIQQRAAAREATRAARRGSGIPVPMGLAWAATVVLALGVGWYVGQDAGSPGTVQAERLAAPAEAPATLDEVQGARVPDALAESEMPPADASARELQDRADPSVADRSRREVEADAPAEALRSLERAALAAPPAQGLRTGLEDALAGGMAAGAGSLVIPGLKVLRVSWDEAAGLTGLKIDQLLPTGDTIELRYVGLFAEALESPGSAAEEAEGSGNPALAAQIQKATLPPGWRQVFVRKGSRWLVARAPIPESEIRAYLMTLK